MMAENLQPKKVTLQTHYHTIFGGKLSHD